MSVSTGRSNKLTVGGILCIAAGVIGLVLAILTLALAETDAGSWRSERAVSVHIALSGLSDGVHTVYVIGKDAAGNWQAEALATTASWTAAATLTPPIAALTGQPAGVVNDNTAEITVAGIDVVAYKYKLDAASWGQETAVSDHILLSGLSDGVHTVYVIGKDAAGNWQAEALATTASWTVATTLTPPIATLTGQPTGVVNDNTAEITVAGTDVVAYKYRLPETDGVSSSTLRIMVILTSIIPSAIAVVGGYFALRRKNFWLAILGGAAGVLSLPLLFIWLPIPAVILIVLSKKDFQ